jgi:hypothetical protein
VPATISEEDVVVGTFRATLDPNELHHRLGMFKNGSYERACVLLEHLRANPGFVLLGKVVDKLIDKRRVRYLEPENAPKGSVPRFQAAQFGRHGYHSTIEIDLS